MFTSHDKHKENIITSSKDYFQVNNTLLIVVFLLIKPLFFIEKLRDQVINLILLIYEK